MRKLSTQPNKHYGEIYCGVETEEEIELLYMHKDLLHMHRQSKRLAHSELLTRLLELTQLEVLQTMQNTIEERLSN